MPEVALHITINRAGDPEKLAALVNAAVSASDEKVRTVVPNGYHCVECYRHDGSHEDNCSCAVKDTKREGARENVGSNDGM